MIDYAEALTVIDVNTGSFIGRGKGARLEDTITKTNLEAADEVVNQLRLRDIGGIIVIDFIDMARARNRDAVMKTLRKALDEDRTKTFIVEISPLGLVEMTRQNVTEGVREIMTRPCPTCDGEGVISSEETIAIEFERRMREIAAESPEVGGLPAPDEPARQRAVHRARCARAHALEAQTGKCFHFEGSEGLRDRPLRRHFEGSRDEVLERACHSARATRCSSRSSSRTCTSADDARRQDRRLHHLGSRARHAVGREADGPHRGGRPHRRGRRARPTIAAIAGGDRRGRRRR